jgi:hypothetical protein
MPENLQQDYSKPYGQMCLEYTRYIVETTDFLGILDRALVLMAGYPSWVVDLRTVLDRDGL